MPLPHVQEGVGDRPSENRDVGQRHGVLGAELEHEDVDGHEYSTAADAAGRGYHEPRAAQYQRKPIMADGGIYYVASTNTTGGQEWGLGVR